MFAAYCIDLLAMTAISSSVAEGNYLGMFLLTIVVYKDFPVTLLMKSSGLTNYMWRMSGLLPLEMLNAKK